MSTTTTKRKTKQYKVLRVTQSWVGCEIHAAPMQGTVYPVKYLPRSGRPGQWLPTVKDPSICGRGWHLTTNPREYIREWLSTSYVYVVFEAEGRGAKDTRNNMTLGTTNKTAHQSIRLLRRVMIVQKDRIYKGGVRGVMGFHSRTRLLARLPWETK